MPSEIAPADLLSAFGIAASAFAELTVRASERQLADPHAFAEQALGELAQARILGRRPIVPRPAARSGRKESGIEQALAVLSDRLRAVERAVAELRAEAARDRRRDATMKAAGASAPE